MLYPRTLNLIIPRGSTFDMVVRFKSEGTLMDISAHNFVATFYNLDKEEITTATIDRPSANSIEVYLSREQTPLFLANGSWKLAVTLPNTTRTYFILQGKVTVRS